MTATSTWTILDRAHSALRDTDVLLLDLDLAGRDSTELIGDLQALCPGRILVLTGAQDAANHNRYDDDGDRDSRGALICERSGRLH